MDTFDRHPDCDLRVEQFFAELPTGDRNIEDAWLNYIGVKRDGIWSLLRARLDFNPLPNCALLPIVDLDSVRAGRFNLGKARTTPADLIEQLHRGEIALEGHAYRFLKGGGPQHVPDLTRDVYQGETNRPVVNRLQFFGEQNNDIWDYSAAQLDLKGLPDFHSSLEDLVGRYGLRTEFGSAAFWLYALPKAQLIRFGDDAGVATIEVSVRPGYDNSLVTLAVSEKGHGRPRAAITIPNSELDPQSDEHQLRLVAKVPMKDLADPEVIVMYDRKVQHIARPAFRTTNFPMYLSADPALDYIREGTFGDPDDDDRDAQTGKKSRASSSVARRRKPILRSVSNRLHTHSRNKCAFDGCGQDIYEGETAMANICHIRSPTPRGPRFDPNQTDDECRAYENLILLCRNHHGLVDSDVDTYPPERLYQMKAAHESKPV